MARVSFTLRSTGPDQGSYLRYDDDTFGVRPDYDSALRADNLQVSPLDFPQSFFEATSVCYNEVDLNWGVDLADTITDTPAPTETLLVYSNQGEPQTIASGDILVESDDTFSFVHEGLPEGRWAYYSLFVRYQSTGGDDYYERVASIPVLVPKDYGSTRQLWKRIPEWYRVQDELLGSTDYSPCIGQVDFSGIVGPLYKYLSIFGFDLDRMRTIVDYTMTARDPDVAHGEILDALAKQLGIPMSTSDLGVARLRNLLSDIGTYRRSKGTVAAIQFITRALSGANVTIDQDTGEIKVYAQRVNYITVPKTGTGLVTDRPAGDVEVDTPEEFSSTTYNAYDTYDVTGTKYVTNGTGVGDDVNHVMIHINANVPVQIGDRVGFGVHSNIGIDGIKWVRCVDGDTQFGISYDPLDVGGSKSFEVVITEGASAGVWTDVDIELLVDLSAVPEFALSSLIAERNHLGLYFDGDTTRGGWLIDSSSISDYRWAGSANSSRSVFSEDYERTKGVLGVMLPTVLPITEESKYSIVSYSAIPGVS